MEIDRTHEPPSPQPGDPVVEQLKAAAAQAAAALVQDGMAVGLGTGSTVAHLLPALARRELSGLRCVPTSPATESQAQGLGLTIVSLDDVKGQLDIAIDGADQVSPEGWLIKGGGGAHTREKIIAVAANRFVVIISAEKLVTKLRPPVPLELLRFGLAVSMRALDATQLRDVPPSPDGNLIADYLGPIEDPSALAALLSATPGVIEHGLFAPQTVSEVLVGEMEGVRLLPGAKHTSQS